MFIVVTNDNIAQIGDSVRITASKTYAPKGSPAITQVEIQPEATESFINVTGATPLNPKNWVLDWVYLTEGPKVGTVKVTQVGGLETYQSFSVEVLTAEDDKLYSTDNDLIYLEHDVLNYLPQGRTNYNYLHRKCQTQILDWLDAIRVTRQNGDKLQKQDVNMTDDLRELSAAWVLMNLFFELSNKNDDKFYEKYLAYSSKVKSIKSRGRILADTNGDSTPETLDFKSFRMIRR